MAIYKKFTGNTTDTALLKKHVNREKVSKFYIACVHDTTDLTLDRLYIDDGSNEYDIIANVIVPVGAALSINIPNYSTRKFDLKVTTTGASNCTIIIT